MKKLIILSFLFIITTTAYSLTLTTGTNTIYFPVAAPMVANKNGDKSSCFVTKISKAQGYTDDTYELQLTSADWVGASVFPVTFTYLVKPDTKLYLKKCVNIYLGPEFIMFVVTSVTENEINLKEYTSDDKEITTTEDTV